MALEPLSVRDRVGLTLIGFSLCVASCGGIMWHGRGATARVGDAMLAAGLVASALTIWWLEPHKAAKHATHRLRYHIRNAREWRRQRPQPVMTDAEFDAIENALER